MGKTFGEYVKEVCKLSNEDYIIAREIGLISDEFVDMIMVVGLEGEDKILELERYYKNNKDD